MMTLKEALIEEYKEKGKQLVETFLQPSLHAVLLHPDKISDEDFLRCYPHVQPHPILPHAYLYDKQEYELGKSLLHQMGAFYLQDPSAMVPAFFLPLFPGEIVLDACAAPGGKTIQLALREKNAIIFSNEIQYARAEILSSNVERMGLGNVLVHSSSIDSLRGLSFSSILLDAPCSGSGMVRKDARMESDWSIEKVKKNAKIQEQLLHIASTLLKPGGYLLYSTCSYSPSENHLQIEHFLSTHSDFEVVEIPLLSPYNFLKQEVGYLLTPLTFPGEGQYLCLLKKKGMTSIPKEVSPFTFTYKNWKCSLPFFFSMQKQSFLRPGLKISENKNGIEKFDHAYGVYQDSLSIELTLEETKQYIRGECVRKKAPKGWISLSYHGIHFAIGKSDGEQIKNHYPKGLRRSFSDLLPF